tara:strand:+ start:7474 stop:7575 length:102 start_codon:yes stop_codon:yes gene_type:complete
MQIFVVIMVKDTIMNLVIGIWADIINEKNEEKI